jgi:hypothetical protein
MPERRNYPVYEEHPRDPMTNVRLQTFAEATLACLPLITDTLRAELRATPDVKKSMALMAQLGAVAEITRSVNAGTGREAENVNRLIKLGIQQEKRRAVSEKIREAQRAVENPPVPRKTRPFLKRLSFAEAVKECLPLITDTLRASLVPAPSKKIRDEALARLNEAAEITRAVKAGTDGLPENVNRLIKLGARMENRPFVFEKIRETQKAVEAGNPAMTQERERKRGRSL